MGSLFIGQQFLQNVLGYSTVNAGLAILPAALFMFLVAPRSAKLIEAYGSRVTLPGGYFYILLGFPIMFVPRSEGIPYWIVGLGYTFLGVGVRLAGTPASHSLTGLVPVTRVGMASGTAELQCYQGLPYSNHISVPCSLRPMRHRWRFSWLAFRMCLIFQAV
jgi:MFS transporter, DHA2 family, multidrug resistance protein